MHKMRKVMKIIKLFFGAFLWAVAPTYAYADCSSSGGGIQGFIDWILCAIVSFFLGIFSSCQEVPDFTGFQSGTMQLDVTQSGQWVATDATVTENTAIQIHWGAEVGAQGVVVSPMRYAVMYRIDPRFARPQLFILTYNYSTNKYDSDFHLYNNGSLVTDQSGGNPLLNVINDYDNYFNFVNRGTMQVNANDIVNISLISSSAFLNYSSAFNGQELVGKDTIANISTKTNLRDNNIMYLDSATYCNGLNAKGCVSSSSNPATTLYALDAVSSSNLISGILYDTVPSSVCPAGATGPNFQVPAYSANVRNYTYQPCVYDAGRAMPISVGGTIVKNVYSPFTYSNITGNNFFSYQSTGGGALDFISPSSDPYFIPISGMYENQLMSSWPQLAQPNSILNSSDIASALAGSNTSALYAGRYMMDVVIGGGNVSQFNAQNNLQLQYIIVPAGQPAPTNNIAGTAADQNYAGNANIAGNLYVRVLNPNNNIAGNITVGYTYYTGTTFLSDVLYGSIVQPVQAVIFSTASLFYSALAVNPTLKWIIGTLLTFYIGHNTVRFLAGMKEVTMNTLLEDVIRIVVVVAVLNSTSWEFFYTHVFRIFLEGMTYLFVNVVGLTSNVNNPFGFVDVIFEKYTDPTLWTLILAEVLSFGNGLTVVGIAVIFAILSFLSTVLEVVISYVFAYVVIAVLISMAPLFIICMLFERTRGIFDNWLSLMFNYMIQPTVLLVFFLLLDQLMTNQLNQVLTRACWGWMVALDLTFDLSFMGLGTVKIPMGLGIPALIPQVSSDVVPGPTNESASSIMGILGAALMFCIYSRVAEGMGAYVTQIVSTLTGAQSSSSTQGGGAPQAIAKQITGAAKRVGGTAMAPVRAVGRELKEKLWDGKGSKSSSGDKGGNEDSGNKKQDSGSMNSGQDNGGSPVDKSGGTSARGRGAPKGGGGHEDSSEA